MKTMSVGGILFAVVVIVASAGTEPDIRKTCGDRGLLLTISMPEGRHKPEARIPLTLTIANTSPDAVHLPSGFTYAQESDEGRKTVAIGSGTFIICQRQGGEYLTFKGGYAKVDGAGQTLKAGQAVKAFVVPRPGSCPTEREVLTHCQKVLEPLAVPQLVEILDELPKAATGKVDKAKLARGTTT